MEELWRGSNECLIFGLARASNIVASTLSVSAEETTLSGFLAWLKKAEMQSDGDL
jgi:hypothetical protein